MDLDDAPVDSAPTAEAGSSAASSDSRVPVALDLTETEIRALGCLIEKESTTPDQYPLTTKGLVTACNQKSNRDPVLSVTETEIDQAMINLRNNKDLVRAVHQAGARSTKHRHVMDEAWGLTKPQMAVVAVLFLRGAQTPGELRQRTDRINHFDTIGDLTAVLQQLVERRPPLVRELPREPGRRESRWSHLVGEAQDVSVHHDLSPTPAPEPEGVVEAGHQAPVATPAPTSVASAADSAPIGSQPATVSAPPAVATGASTLPAEATDDETVTSPRPVVTSAGAKPPKPPSATASEVEELRERVSTLEASIATLQDKIQSLTGL